MNSHQFHNVNPEDLKKITVEDIITGKGIKPEAIIETASDYVPLNLIPRSSDNIPYVGGGGGMGYMGFGCSGDGGGSGDSCD